MNLLFFYFLYLFLFLSSVFAQQSALISKETPEYQPKKRLTEILLPENHGLVEPFFHVSNRPTLREALAEDIKHNAHKYANHMTYCAPQQYRQYGKRRPNKVGTVYLSAKNLPKNSIQTQRLFLKAYQYRQSSDPLKKPANVTITSPTRGNFLQSRCSNQRHFITLADQSISNTKPYSNSYQQKSLIKKLNYGKQRNSKWNLDLYTLPSNIQKGRLKRQATGIEQPKKYILNAPENYVNFARNASNKHGVFIKFLLAIAKVSSEFDANKISEKGTKLGIMQLPFTILQHYNINREEAFKSQKAFEIASIYIKDLSVTYSGNTHKILTAYYLGLSPNRRDQNLPDIAEAKSFSNTIMGYIDPDQPILLK